MPEVDVESLQKMDVALKAERSLEERYKELKEQKRKERIEAELRSYEKQKYERAHPLRSETSRYPGRVKRRSSRFVSAIGRELLSLRMKHTRPVPANPQQYKRNRSSDVARQQVKSWYDSTTSSMPDSIKNQTWGVTESLMQKDFFGNQGQGERVFFESKPQVELVSDPRFKKDMRLL